MEWNYLSIPKLQWYNRWSLGMEKQLHATPHRAGDYLSMLGSKLIHVGKRGLQCELEQLECLRSEIAPHRPMITHTRGSQKIPSQNKTKSKLQIFKKLPKIQILQETLHATHLLKLLDKMYKYEMDPTWYPVMLSSLYNSSEDHVSIDEIYRC